MARATKIFQTFNKRNNAWVKMKKMPDGSVQVMNVKEKEPKKKFKGVPVKNGQTS